MASLSCDGDAAGQHRRGPHTVCPGFVLLPHPRAVVPSVGMSGVRMGNLHKAKALALQGIKRAPDHPALWTVGLTEDRLGEHARARKLLESGIDRFGDHGPLYKVLGEQNERLGDFQSAKCLPQRPAKRPALCPSIPRRRSARGPSRQPLYRATCASPTPTSLLELDSDIIGCFVTIRYNNHCPTH